MSAGRLTCCAVIALGLSACSLNPFRLGSDDGRPLASGDSVTLHFFTKDPGFDTGVSLQSGSRYNLDITILSYWIDSYIEENENNEPLDERGFANSVMAYEWLGATRRSRQHRWFELMLYQPECRRDSLQGVTELEVDEETGGYTFVAACDGNLTLFVNDTRGFYGNNVGYANISLSRVD